MTKTAIVLFNLGGPDSLDAVRPFLFNLFNDPAIISLPGPVRRLLAWFIAARRAPVARDIYRKLGGASPLLAETGKQAQALETALGEDSTVFVAMRYWHPFSAETAEAVRASGAEEVVLLPLYPQYSSTTTGTSLADWVRAAADAGLRVPTRIIGCYPTAPGLIGAHAALLRRALDALGERTPRRVLFSAHGLPESVIAAGDPYQWQVEQTAAAVVDALDWPALDWVLCYQSRVGPRRWLGPAIGDEIKRAAADRTAVAVVPIAFVSEHSETLVELDIDYRRLAEAVGVPAFVRVPALGSEALFIDQLAALVRHAKAGRGPCAHGGARLCPSRFVKCGCARTEGLDD